jgi:hypothetical protein
VDGLACCSSLLGGEGGDIDGYRLVDRGGRGEPSGRGHGDADLCRVAWPGDREVADDDQELAGLVAEDSAIVRVELVMLVRRERLAHGVDEQVVEVRTLDPLEDDLVEVSEPAGAEVALALDLEVILGGAAAGHRSESDVYR